MRILVTGGYGFIGSHFIRHLLRDPKTEVVNLDKLTYAGIRQNLADVQSESYRFVQGDIQDQGAVRTAMQDCDAVVHFAAASHVDRSIHDVSPFIQTNIQGTGVLLEEARKHDISSFVMISTDEVYGQIEHGTFKETDMLNPRNPYAATKAGAEYLAHSFFVTYGLPVIITRSSNNFGPYQHPEKLIPRFITNILQGKQVPLYGDGKNVRDWIYVEDNCHAIRHCLEAGTPGEMYNIGGGNEMTNIELTKLILQELGKGEEMIEFVDDRPGHDLRYALDSEKIKTALNWHPRHDFHTALKRTIEWYRDNPEWWKPLITP